MADIEIKYKASKTLAKFHKSSARVRAIRGPFGSGKSSGCVLECVKMSGWQKPDQDGIRRTRGAIIRNTFPQLKSTTIKTWIDWLGPFTSITYGSPITAKLKMPWIDGTTIEAEIFFISGDKDSDIGKLKSLDLSWVWVNEASEVPKAVIDVAHDRTGRYPSVRNGGCTNRGMILDTNSMDDDHWWYELDIDTPDGWEFFAQPPALLVEDQADGTRRYLDNPMAENVDYLPDGFAYYHEMVPGKTKEYVDVFVRNLYGSLSNNPRVYPDYTDHNITEKEFDWEKSFVCWTHDQNFLPMSSAIIQVEGGNDYIVDEIVIESADANTVATEFIERYKGYLGTVILYGDSYGRHGEKHGIDSYFRIIADRLRGAGFRVMNKALTKNPSVKTCQDTLRARICDAEGNRSLFCNPIKAPTAHRGLKKTEFKIGSTVVEDEVYYQHITTAIRYYTYKEYPIRRGTVHQGRA